MSVNLPDLGELHAVPGMRCATVQAGIRQAERDDLVLIELCEGARSAGVFTRNRFRAAPVEIAEQRLSAAAPRYLLINTGNANAGTGQNGFDDARASCAAVAREMGVDESRVLPFSTGVIGERLPAERLIAGVPAASSALDPAGWARAAGGIMTTDTGPKGVSVVVPEHGWTVTGIAKGAGMIRPDMATMLAFVGVDAEVAPEVLDAILRSAVDESFHRISVDGDTSTNDAVILTATGQADGVVVDAIDSAPGRALLEAVTRVCVHLAQAIVRDGEGATRFVTVHVGGAASSREALDCAFTIAHSPLVKTALFAGDPNWGRLLAAIGRCGIDDLDVSGVTVRLGNVTVARGGGLAEDYEEARGAEVMAQPEVEIGIDLGRGIESVNIWTTDLSYDYVRINAEYRS